MKFIATFSTSIAALATLAATNPLPLGSDARKALLPRADIVEVTCPAVNNAGEVKYSVREIDDAFNIGSGLLRPPPHWVTGANGMNRIPNYLVERWARTDAYSSQGRTTQPFTATTTISLCQQTALLLIFSVGKSSRFCVPKSHSVMRLNQDLTE